MLYSVFTLNCRHPIINCKKKNCYCSNEIMCWVCLFIDGNFMNRMCYKLKRSNLVWMKIISKIHNFLIKWRRKLSELVEIILSFKFFQMLHFLIYKKSIRECGLWNIFIGLMKPLIFIFFFIVETLILFRRD